jgi:predicted MPP superfamily phosphohydrolase
MWRELSLLIAFSPIALALAATAVSLWQLSHFRIRRLRVKVPHLPPALQGLSIVHVSDLHIGKLTRGKVLADIVVATNALDPDLILMTGDLINMALEDLPQAFALVRSLKARHGVFACEGNHDLIESRAGFEAAVAASGLPFLLNASATVVIKDQPVQILGLRWGEGMERGTERKGSVAEGALHRLLDSGDADAFRILLVHHPEAFDTAVEAGIPLTLAGHTHGGQLMLTPKIGFGPWLYRYWSGLYEKDGCQMVVSNGAGNWFPIRIGAPAEIIHLTLV